MKVNWNYIKGILILALVLFLYGFSNHRNKALKIVSIDVLFEQGDNLFMNYEMVNNLLIQNEKGVQNQAKSLIDLNSLEKQVLSHPMVEDATTYFTVDGRLKTSVKQRMPIGRVNTEKSSYYIDREGAYMPLSNNHSAHVPVVTGVSNGDSTDNLHQLLMYIIEDNFLKKQIIGVHQYEENQYHLMTRVGKHEIDLGKITNLQAKFKNLKAFYNYTMANKTIENYSKINLKYNNQVVCTKKGN